MPYVSLCMYVWAAICNAMAVYVYATIPTICSLYSLYTLCMYPYVSACVLYVPIHATTIMSPQMMATIYSICTHPPLVPRES